MKRVYALLLICFSILLLTVSSFASTVEIYVDTAPNKFGSPNYAGWENTTFAAVANGTFKNMRNGTNPANVDTTEFVIQDEVVYSFGDLGKRLTWIYWVPGETIQSLTSKNFQISLFNYWGNDPELDFYDYYYGVTWLTPGSWIEYNDGVIGTAGMAWWGAKGVNTQEALDSDIAAWQTVEESWKFTVRLDDQEFSLTSHRAPVPEPATMLLLGFGLLGVAGIGRRKK